MEVINTFRGLNRLGKIKVWSQVTDIANGGMYRRRNDHYYEKVLLPKLAEEGITVEAVDPEKDNHPKFIAWGQDNAEKEE